MDELKDEAVRRNIHFEVVLTEGPAADALIKTARQKAANLIVFTVRKGESTEPNVITSTAEQAIRECPVPVLSIPITAKVKPMRGDAETGG